jgi:hypothetical protein
MYFDRFDIVEAYYLFFSHYHRGQFSNEYIRLSKIIKYFKPRFNLSYETLTENGKIIYTTLEKKAI